eukprot:GHVN01067016.1.p1 GENE.GHVN01067016.1~~GHVN01067016.1.p1  ORF type:complete len:1223 (-),score=93.83 GHVN01067016.1:5879-9547(-)
MSQFSYFVPKYPPTKVTSCAFLPFSTANPQLVLARSHTLVVCDVQHRHISSRTIHLNAVVKAIAPFCPPGQTTNALAVLTDTRKLIILAYDHTKLRIVTLSALDLNDPDGKLKPNENPKISIDPQHKCIAANLYAGYISVAMLDSENRYTFKPAPLRLSVSALEAVDFHVVDVRTRKRRLVDQNVARASTSSILLPQENADVEQDGAMRPVLVVLSLNIGQRETKSVRWIDISSFRADQQLPEIYGEDTKVDEIGVASTAEVLLPLQDAWGSCMVIGGSIAGFLQRPTAGGQGDPVEVTLPIRIETTCAVPMTSDRTRWVVGDSRGRLILVGIEPDSAIPSVGLMNPLKTLACADLGRCTFPHCLTFLGPDLIFVGSEISNSEIFTIRHNSDAIESRSHALEIRHTITNLGPVLGLTVVDVDKNGEPQVWVAGGYEASGALRVVRYGVGLHPTLAEVEAEGISGLWSLKREFGDYFHTYILQSFYTESRIVGYESTSSFTADFSECKAPGLDLNSPTVLAGNLNGTNRIIQVTPESVRLADSITLELIETWRPNGAIDVACISNNVIVVGLSGGEITVMRLAAESLSVIASTRVEGGVSCMYLSADLLCVGIRSSCTISLYQVGGGLNLLQCELVDEELPPLSVAIVQMRHTHYIFAAIGDGRILSFMINDEIQPKQVDADEIMGEEGDATSNLLFNRRVTSLGLHSPVLEVLPDMRDGQNSYNEGQAREAAAESSRTPTEMNLFALGDRPTVLHSKDPWNLLSSPLTGGQITHICRFLCPPAGAGQHLTVWSTPTKFCLGHIDEIQTYHIKTVPLGYTPVTVTLHSKTGLACVGCNKEPITYGAQESFLILIDVPTQEVKHKAKLGDSELCTAMLCCTLKGSDEEYLIVGSRDREMQAIDFSSFPDRGDNCQGRLRMFALTRDNDNRIVVEEVWKSIVDGVVYGLKSSNGRLVAAVNHKIEIFELTVRESPFGGSVGLNHVTSNSAHTHVVALDTWGDAILAGDLQRSAGLFKYLPENGRVEEVARDYSNVWTTAVACLSEDTFAVADSSNNVCVLSKKTNPLNDEDRCKLSPRGLFHAGEMINCLVSVPSTTKHENKEKVEGESIIVNKCFWGAVEGGLGVVLSLKSEEQFLKLALIEDAVSGVLDPIGGLSHSEWRHFRAEWRTNCRRGFVDGNVVEKLLELPPSKQREAFNIAKRSPLAELSSLEEMLNEVDRIQRLH